MFSIYVLPTEEGQPPKAWLGEYAVDGFLGVMGFTWIPDNGYWTDDATGERVPEELDEAITNHARRLGVPTFQ